MMARKSGSVHGRESWIVSIRGMVEWEGDVEGWMMAAWRGREIGKEGYEA